MEARSIVQRPDGRTTSPATANAQLRARMHGMWAAVAGAWGEHADYVDTRGAAVAQALLEQSSPRPGERVLELAGGPGGMGLAAAALVAPGGEVVVSDVVAEMTAIAAARAASLGLDNVRTRELDFEDIDEPAGSYDIVLCREGLMFATDPARSAREIQRVLRPGGRVALAVWGPRERNPWLGLVFDAVSAQTGAPVPPPGVPGPFSLGDAGRLAALLGDAGLSHVVVSEFPIPLQAGSFDEWWAKVSVLAGPLAKLLAALPEEATEALCARLREAVRPYVTEAGIEIPGVALIASARR